MEYFFFSALVSFLLMTPVLRNPGFRNKIAKSIVLHLTLSLIVIVLFVVSELTHFPEYFVGHSTIGSAESVRILLGLYFGCIWRCVWHHLLWHPQRMSLEAPEARQNDQPWSTSKGNYIRAVANWPTIILSAVFMVALLVPHLDGWLSSAKDIRIGGFGLTLSDQSTRAFDAVEQITYSEVRDIIPDSIVAAIILNGWSQIVDKDRIYYSLIEHTVTDQTPPRWLRKRDRAADGALLLEDAQELIDSLIGPYLRCVHAMYFTERSDPESIRVSLRPVSLALERFIANDTVVMDEVVEAINTGLDSLRQLAPEQNAPCSGSLAETHHPHHPFFRTNFEKNVRDAYYIYLYVAHLKLLQGNLPGTTLFLDKHGEPFEDEGNYLWFRGFVSYIGDEPIENMVDWMRKGRDVALRAMAALRMEKKRRRIDGAHVHARLPRIVSDSWIAQYEEQMERLRYRVSLFENQAAYEVTRAIAAGWKIKKETKSIGARYLKNLEQYIDSDAVREGNVLDDLTLMSFEDTVGLGNLVLGLNDGTLSEREAHKALERLRRAERLADELWLNANEQGGQEQRRLIELNRKKIHNHLAFAARILTRTYVQ